MSENEQNAPLEPELTLIEKVSLMHDLASACKDEKVVGVIKSLKNGDRIFDLFVAAIEKELGSVMSGKKEELPRQVTDLLSATVQLTASTKVFRDMIQAFMNTPLVAVLEMMNKNLGGRSPQSQQAAPQVTQQQMQQQQIDQRYNGETDESYAPKGQRSTGLGSF